MAKSYRLIQVDVFTERPLSGNPLAVFPEAHGLGDDEMQAIAREMNLSETTFVLPAEREDADYRMRIFTPQSELPFAGHPTVGTAHALLEGGHLKVRGDRFTVRQQTLAGVQEIEICREAGWTFTMTQPTPTFAPGPPAAELARALRIDAGDIVNEPLTVAVGVAWHIVPLASLERVRSLAPDMGALAELERRSGVATTVFTQAAERPECSVRLRSFAPGDGIPEDPVCGSGNGCVGAYQVYTGMAEAPLAYRAEQGCEMGRAGEVSVAVDRSGSDLRVRVGGRAVTIVEGTLTL